MSFDKFKKVFFPHLYLINESEESDAERMTKEDKQIFKQSPKLKGNKIDTTTDVAAEPEAVLAERLKKLEKILKTKFANNWESVRKAFLDLD